MSKLDPVVSVWMPVFNRELFVADAIRSIQNQTFQDWELLILDDGSQDRTYEICLSFTKEDSRIRLFSNERNEGIPASRNKLVPLTKGKYIANQDSDDISVPDRLAMQVEALESNSHVGLVSGICEIIDLDGNILSYAPKILLENKQFPQEKDEILQLLYAECVVQNPTCMYRASILSEIPGPFDVKLKMCSDWRFLIDVAHRHQIIGIPRVLVKFRRGMNHVHLWNDMDRGFQYAHECLRGVYQDYKQNGFGISYLQYRKTLAGMLLWEGSGCRWSMSRQERVLRSIHLYPAGRRAWKALFRMLRRRLIP
jgi:glycosyltransferase involved in cell wall biosynthesis